MLTVSVSNVFLIKDCMLDVFTWKLSTWNHRALWVQEIILFSVDDLKKAKPPTTSYINACLNQSTTSPQGCLLNMFASSFVTSAPHPLTYHTTQCEYQGRGQGWQFSGGEVREERCALTDWWGLLSGRGIECYRTDILLARPTLSAFSSLPYRNS